MKQKYVTKIEHDVRCGKAQHDGCLAVGWVQTIVLFVTVCGPKFTKLTSHIRARLQFAVLFSDCRQFVELWRHSRSSHGCPKWCWKKFGYFWAANFWGDGSPNLWHKFINLGQHWTCGKVNWRLAKAAPRLRGKKT